MARNARNVQKKIKTTAPARKKKIPTTQTAKRIKFVNRRNRFGETLLHEAVLKADIQLLKDTLKLGANVNRTDNTGRTALHEAAVRNQYEACCCLVNAGALVNIETRNKATPLHEAITFGNKRIVELLQKHQEQQFKAKEEQTTFGIIERPSCQVQGEDVQNKESDQSKQNQTEVPRGNPKTLTSASQLLSTKDNNSLTQDLPGEETDSDQTVNYLGESSESEDWSIYATQNFC
ncbi:uncharacterized protein LOC144074519 [Stigmatopora argus]